MQTGFDTDRADMRNAITEAKNAIQQAKNAGLDVSELNRLLGDAVGYSYRLDFIRAKRVAELVHWKAVNALAKAVA